MCDPETPPRTVNAALPETALAAIRAGDSIRAIKILHHDLELDFMQARAMVEEHIRGQSTEASHDAADVKRRPPKQLPVLPPAPWYAALLILLRCELLRRMLLQCHATMRCEQKIPDVFACEGYSAPEPHVRARHILVAKRSIFLWAHGPSDWSFTPEQWSALTVNDFLSKYMDSHISATAKLLAMYEVKKSIAHLVRDGEFAAFEASANRYESRLRLKLLDHLAGRTHRLAASLFGVLACAQKAS